MSRQKVRIIGCRSNCGNRHDWGTVSIPGILPPTDLDLQMKTNIICTYSILPPHAMSIRFGIPVALLAALLSTASLAENTFTIVFKDHRIVPAEVQVPAGEKITLIVDNQDPTPEEFESHSLKREKVIPARSKATIKIGPLKPGTYEIFGEYHEATAQGRIIAK